MGSLHGGPLSIYQVNQNDVEAGNTLQCFSVNNELLYSTGIFTEDCEGLTISIEELSESQVRLFPNPITTNAVLDVGELKGPAKLEIYDVTGKLQRLETMNLDSGKILLERKGLESGNYLLRLLLGEERRELPFMVR